MTTMAWSSIAGVGIVSALVPFAWVAPSWHDILFGIFIGVASTAGQWIVVLAFRYADASVLAPFSYTQLLWVSILGFLIFGEVPDIWTVLGLPSSSAAVSTPRTASASGGRSFWRWTGNCRRTRDPVNAKEPADRILPLSSVAQAQQSNRKQRVFGAGSMDSGAARKITDYRHASLLPTQRRKSAAAGLWGWALRFRWPSSARDGVRERAVALCCAIAVAAAGLVPGTPAQAQSQTWGGTGSSTATAGYKIGTNWSHPPAGDRRSQPAGPRFSMRRDRTQSPSAPERSRRIPGPSTRTRSLTPSPARR